MKILHMLKLNSSGEFLIKIVAGSLLRSESHETIIKCTFLRLCVFFYLKQLWKLNYNYKLTRMHIAYTW